MPLLEKIITIFAPHTCLGCGLEDDKLLCEACLQAVVQVPSRCYRCKAVTDDYRTCHSCAPRTPLTQVVVYTHHQDLAKELVHRMKYERARAGIIEAARLMAERSIYLPKDALLTHVPTASSRVRERGYDHARLLAQTLSQVSSLPAPTLLSRVGQAHQVGASRTERLRQLRNAFRPVHSEVLRGKHIVLVDDVLTTAATLETAARVLKRAGAKQVSAVVFAQA